LWVKPGKTLGGETRSQIRSDILGKKESHKGKEKPMNHNPSQRNPVLPKGPGGFHRIGSFIKREGNSKDQRRRQIEANLPLTTPRELERRVLLSSLGGKIQGLEESEGRLVLSEKGRLGRALEVLTGQKRDRKKGMFKTWGGKRKYR